MSEETFPGEAGLVAAAAGELTYVDTGETEEELLAKLPPATEDVDDMLVVTSLRIPMGLNNRLKEYAAVHNTKPSVLIRQWIELHLTADDDRPILLADAIRALAAVRPAA
jgi:predicted transcriptional regulator